MATNRELQVPADAEHPYPQRVPDIARRVVEAAQARTNDEKAWALVRLGADLRVLGDISGALRALDAAWELRPTIEPARAMWSCAIAAHCDNADYLLAHRVAHQLPEGYHDVKFSRAAARLYATLLEETGEECWAVHLAHYRTHLESVDSATVAVHPTA